VGIAVPQDWRVVTADGVLGLLALDEVELESPEEVVELESSEELVELESSEELVELESSEELDEEDVEPDPVAVLEVDPVLAGVDAVVCVPVEAEVVPIEPS
jgi:hypothetical protein